MKRIANKLIAAGVITALLLVNVPGLAATSQLPTCTITGKVFLANGKPAAGVVFQVKKIVRGGYVIDVGSKQFRADSSGVVRMTLPRASTCYLYAPVPGFDRDQANGMPFDIPDEAAVRLAVCCQQNAARRVRGKKR
jgi:hypothetical protein